MVSTLAIRVSLLLLAFAAPQQNQAPARSTRSPHGPMATPCQNCHTFSGWRPLRQSPEFDHNQTKYPLRGMHKNVACTQCHTNLVFSNVGNKCADCHADIHRRQMGAQCEQCHSVLGWRVSLQSVRQHTNRFPLVGAHALTDCESCHKGMATGQFQGAPTQCAGCHLNSYLQAKSPDHRAAGFPTQCEQCHRTMDTWLGASFDHAKFTGFALSGAHARLQCSDCHVGGRFQGTPANCIGCHAADFNGAKDPDHVKLGFPQQCSQCHNMNSWAGAKFDHAGMTGFPLMGAHASVACAQCHLNGRYAGTPTTCMGCHSADFNNTKDPSHVALAFPQQCTQCHNMNSWTGATFDHSTVGFPLVGAHANVACSQCHVNGKYAGTPTTCIGCHSADINNAKDPNHVTLGFPQQCTQCHNMNSWGGATFDHAALTGFALTGAHTTLACSQCHANNRFAGTPTTCSGCHLTDFQKTTNPNHAAAGFPQDCSICHTTATWAGAVFDHSKTAFPLTGAHTSVTCATCHSSGIYVGLPTACASCHQKDFTGATNPNHVTLGFPQQCETCHNTSAWQPATFNHNNTAFPLTGAHTSVACASCHIGGKFAGTPTDCYSCHKPEYQGTTNPNHVAAGFPTACQTCHTTTTWAGATFNHTWFPVPHRTATLCSDCHTNPSNYTVFVCTNCHTQTQTNSNHSGVSGYVWNSINCYACHKNGRAP